MEHYIGRRRGKTIVISGISSVMSSGLISLSPRPRYAGNAPACRVFLDRNRGGRYKYNRIDIIPIKPNPPRGGDGKSRIFPERKMAELPTDNTIGQPGLFYLSRESAVEDAVKRNGYGGKTERQRTDV